MEKKPLLHWKYTPQQWNNYVAIEKANKKEDNIYFGVGILIVGVIALLFFRETSFLIALVFSLPFAVLVPWLRLQISYPYLKKGAVNPSIQVFQNFMLINQKKIELFGDKRRVKSLKIIDAKDNSKLLEFNVQWLARKGPTNDEFRILIPPEKLNEAQHFISKYQ